MLPGIISIVLIVVAHVISKNPAGLANGIPGGPEGAAAIPWPSRFHRTMQNLRPRTQGCEPPRGKKQARRNR